MKSDVSKSAAQTLSIVGTKTVETDVPWSQNQKTEHTVYLIQVNDTKYEKRFSEFVELERALRVEIGTNEMEAMPSLNAGIINRIGSFFSSSSSLVEERKENLQVSY